jgi:hypothetical protein
MNTLKPGQPSKIWLAFAVSPFEMFIAVFFALYGLISFVISDLVTPPTVQGTVSFGLIIVWHIALALGGICAALGRMLEKERLELSGLAMIGFACGLYAGVLGVSAGWGSSAAVGLLISILGACIARMKVIRRSIQAQELAVHIVEELRHNGGPHQ